MPPAKETMARSGGKQAGVMLALLLAATWPALAASFEDGLAAYSRRDYPMAVRIWRPMAEMGDARAQWSLGFAYQWNFGVAKDDAVAAGWYRKAAEQGHALAQHALGVMYYDGAGIE